MPANDKSLISSVQGQLPPCGTITDWTNPVNASLLETPYWVVCNLEGVRRVRQRRGTIRHQNRSVGRASRRYCPLQTNQRQSHEQRQNHREKHLLHNRTSVPGWDLPTIHQGCTSSMKKDSSHVSPVPSVLVQKSTRLIPLSLRYSTSIERVLTATSVEHSQGPLPTATGIPPVRY